jgi:hypothetical protein
MFCPEGLRHPSKLASSFRRGNKTLDFLCLISKKILDLCSTTAIYNAGYTKGLKIQNGTFLLTGMRREMLVSASPSALDSCRGEGFPSAGSQKRFSD